MEKIQRTNHGQQFVISQRLRFFHAIFSIINLLLKSGRKMCPISLDRTKDPRRREEMMKGLSNYKLLSIGKINMSIYKRKV
jgi:hypothetical protein